MKLRNMASVYITHGNEILLLYRQGSRIANNTYIASAGGHFEKEELNAPRDCVLRELKEELGLEEDAFETFDLRYITLRRKNNEIRQIYYYFAELKDKALIGESDEGELKWVEFEEALSYKMPFTAYGVVEHYLKTGRNTDVLYAGTTMESGVVFHELGEFEDK